MVRLAGAPAKIRIVQNPVMGGVAVSVAVILCWPAVLNVTEPPKPPFVIFVSGGTVAAGSLLVKCTVPA